MLQAFLADQIVTPTGTLSGAVLVDGPWIRAICARAEVPANASVHDCGRSAILPGLVDTHVHINEPGRTEWEGFATATRAAAAGGYTTLVDMPLNCLPETTTVAALAAKRAAATGQCRVDWAAWGGVVADNQQHLPALARAGVPGFKCFLIYPGCDGFTSIDRAQLERPPRWRTRTGAAMRRILPRGRMTPSSRRSTCCSSSAVCIDVGYISCISRLRARSIVCDGRSRTDCR